MQRLIPFAAAFGCRANWSTTTTCIIICHTYKCIMCTALYEFN